MKKIAECVVGVLVIIAVVIGYTEKYNRVKFDESFLFIPSGTYYVIWTGDPNPALKAREQELIKKSLALRYDELWAAHRKMMIVSAGGYKEAREEFLYAREIILDEVEIAHYFGYAVWINDSEDLLEEEEE